MKKLRNRTGSLGIKFILTLVLLLFSQFTPMAPAKNNSASSGSGNSIPGGTTSTTEPIDTTTGNNYFTEERLYVPCPGIPLEMKLEYQSKTTRQESSLGYGWCHSYEWLLVPTPGRAILYNGAGNKYVFEQSCDGNYLSPTINNWKLEAISGGHKLTLPGGKLYFFNEGGRLESIRDAWGNAVTCSYDANNCLRAVVHNNGRRINFDNYVWNPAQAVWRVGTASVPNGASLSFEYSVAGQLTGIKEQTGGIISTSRYQYCGMYLASKVNEAGYKYAFAYKVENDTYTGKGTYLDVDGYYKHTVDYVNSNTTDVAYSTRGLSQRYRYSRDIDDILETIYGPADTIEGAQTLGRSFAYAGNDEIEETRFDDTKNKTWSTYKEYDNSHNVTKLSVAYCGAAKVKMAAYRYDPVWNLPVSVENAEGNRVETVYINGRPKTVKAFYSDTGSYDTHYSYTANGLLTAITNANGHVTRRTYDSAGNLSTVFAERGPVISNRYNSLGFVTQTLVLAENGASSGRSTSFERDVKGRILKTTYPDGRISSNSYNALDYLMSTVDRAGRKTDYTYAPTKKLTSVTQYLEQNGGSVPVRLAYNYDQQFNTLSITEPRGRYVESYCLDIQDRITAVTNIEGQTMTLDYSIGSFVTNVTRFDGSKISAAYDGAGRKAAVSYLAPDNQQLSTINYAYYADSQLKTVSDGVSSISNSYDRLNRLTDFSIRVDSCNSWVVSYSHDPVGNLTNSIVDLGGSRSVATAYRYDQAERLTGISQNSGGLPMAFSYSYSPVNGRVASITNTQSGIVTAYAYDLMDRATNISYRKNGNLIRSLNYQYDALGMITNKVLSGGSSSIATAYKYDTINRLIREASGNSWAEYSYDLAGNRTTVNDNGTASTYTLGSGDRLASITTKYTDHTETKTYAYDAAGCLTNSAIGSQQSAMSFSWNEQYQLTTASSVSSVVNYSYDVLGHRASRTCTAGILPAEVERYVYNGNQVVADLGISGNVLRTYIWGPGIDNLLSLTVWSGGSNSTPTARYYPLKDHQNSVLAMADENGNVVETYEYDACGRVKMYSSTGQPINSSTVGNRYLFQGREYDGQTGLYYFRARWYSPETGRWLSKDPIGISGGLNLYVFCGNNPVNFVDPRGLNVAYLGDADDALGGYGHTAVAVGDDSSGWTYYSFSGGKDLSTPFDNLDVEHYDTLSDIWDAYPRYENSIEYTTSFAEDAAANTAASSWGGATFYPITQNCDDMSTAVMRAGGIDVAHGETPMATYNNQLVKCYE